MTAVGKSVEFWGFLPAIIAVTILVLIVMSNYLHESLDVEAVEDLVVSNVLRNSPNCLALDSETGVMQNVLDLSKMSPSNLAGCYKRSDFSYKITLFSLEGKEIKSASQVPVNLEKYIPVCKSVKTMRCTERKEFVRYKDESGEVKTALLKIEMVRGNV